MIYDNCKYCKDDVCTNVNCLFKGCWCYDVASFCAAREEKEDLSNELNPVYDLYGKEQMKEKIAIEGVGRDAEIIVNENGGKQSKSPMAAYLLDPDFIGRNTDEDDGAIFFIARFMETGDKQHLIDAATMIEPDRIQRLIRISKVLQDGAEKYEPNNWRLIPQEAHLNHALIHLFADTLGDTQDVHLEHALCRIMMAYATEVSEGFSYTKYIKKAE